MYVNKLRLNYSRIAPGDTDIEGKSRKHKDVKLINKEFTDTKPKVVKF